MQLQGDGAKLYLLQPDVPAHHESGKFPRRPPLVLVVDDADDNRLLYVTTIAEAGYDVEEAANGAEALDRVGSRRPAVVVMDLSMPVLDGWEATRRIKSDPRTADVIVIAITAHSTKYGLQQAADAGADAVLTKPCLPVDLIGVIGSLVPDERATG